MSELYKQFNSDNILIRSVISGLLDLLNNKIDYTQIWDDTDTETVIETVRVPWWYSFGTSNERFVQDNYTFFGRHCYGDNKITGTFTPVPSGMITYTSSQIDSSSITNRFVQGTYFKNVKGKLISYTSFLYSMPLTVNFDCEVKCDNIITALKIEQAIRETFYKNKTFHVMFRGMRIGCTVGFPEQLSIEKTTEYSFDNASKNPLIKFQLAVETYQPVFDKTTEIERGKYIKSFAIDGFIRSPYENKYIKIKPFDTDIVYPKGCGMLLEWDYHSENSDMLNVTISYEETVKDENGEDVMKEIVIAEVTDNQGSYIWNVPDNFTDYIQPQITYDSNVNVIEEPIIRIIPNKTNRLIDDNSFIIVKNGYFITDGDEVPFTMEYINIEGNPIVANNYSFILDGNRIELEDSIHIVGEPIQYRNSINNKKISLKISYSNDLSIFDKIDNVLIL